METNGAPAASRTGRNCSRKDGIRGGAVTGPWRSVGASPAPAKPRVAPPVPAASPVPAVAPALASRPAPQPVLRAVEAPAPARPARPHSQRSVWLWTAFGLAISAALVAAALHFRPEPVAPPAAPDTPAVPAPVETTTASTAALRINLRVGPDTPRARNDTIVAALRAAGYDSIEVHVMPFPILRSRVGYFDEMDRGAAATLAATLAPMAEATGGPVELRDYGALDLAPAPGRLDLWIGG